MTINTWLYLTLMNKMGKCCVKTTDTKDYLSYTCSTLLNMRRALAVKTYSLQTFYRVNIETQDSDISVKTDSFTEIDALVVTHYKTLAHQVLTVWQHHCQSNLDNLDIKPLNYFKLIEYDPESESEISTTYNLNRSKPQARSRKYDFILRNDSQSTVERWSEPI